MSCGEDNDQEGSGTSSLNSPDHGLKTSCVKGGTHPKILVAQVGMALLERLEIGLAYPPPRPGAGVELAGPIHRQPSRFVVHHQPLHTIHIRQPRTEVVRVALEDCLDVR